ncbi:MAG: hypothetical protein V4508_21515 [Pseudomonadota bacterium]
MSYTRVARILRGFTVPDKFQARQVGWKWDGCFARWVMAQREVEAESDRAESTLLPHQEGDWKVLPELLHCVFDEFHPHETISRIASRGLDAANRS